MIVHEVKIWREFIWLYWLLAIVAIAWGIWWTATVYEGNVVGRKLAAARPQPALVFGYNVPIYHVPVINGTDPVMTTGSNNTFLGYYAGTSIQAGSNNVCTGNWCESQQDKPPQ